MRAALELPPDDIHVRPWPDPVIDAVGLDPRSAYVERFWLGILGPPKIKGGQKWTDGTVWSEPPATPACR